MLLVTFGPYRKTNPQNCEDHIGNPGRQQMSGCRYHQNYSDHQGHIGPLDVIFGGHDTCPFAITPSLNDHQDVILSRLPLRRLASSGFGCGFSRLVRYRATPLWREPVWPPSVPWRNRNGVSAHAGPRQPCGSRCLQDRAIAGHGGLVSSQTVESR